MKKNIRVLLGLFLLILSSCEEEKLDVVNYGTIQGTVLDGDTYAPVPGVLVTTVPASVSLLTDEQGKFTIRKVKEGEVAVNVKKKDYLSNSLSVAVFENEETTLDFLFFKDDKNIGTVNIYDPVPGNGALDQSTSFTLKWNVEGKRTTDLTYSIYIFESNTTAQKVVGEDIEAKEVTVSDLKLGTTYFWYVVAKYEGNKIAFSPTWSFKVKN